MTEAPAPSAASDSTHWCRFVPHRDVRRIERMLNSGWDVKALKSHHGVWSVLMIWPSVHRPPEED